MFTTLIKIIKFDYCPREAFLKCVMYPESRLSPPHSPKLHAVGYFKGIPSCFTVVKSSLKNLDKLLSNRFEKKLFLNLPASKYSEF